MELNSIATAVKLHPSLCFVDPAIFTLLAHFLSARGALCSVFSLRSRPADITAQACYVLSPEYLVFRAESYLQF